ncbi:SagB/ThcOx family dehydrogenase [bacterium]|nr:SagB/ThcOx family dehydrogenase [bacterium]
MKQKALIIGITALLGLVVFCLAQNDKEVNNKTELATLKVGESLALPSPRLKGDMSLEEALAKRRSIRTFTGTPLSLQEISQLLWAAQGITEPNRGLRTAPSAGATYPYEVYIVLKEGVFHYIPKGHKIEKIKDGDLRGELSTAAFGQASVRDAELVFVLSAIYERTSRYGERAKMFVDIEAGHIAQNILLQAVALKLGSVPVGAFDPKKVKEVTGIPEGEIVYLIPVGHPR